MARVMKSCRLDSELVEWSVGYAKERNVSWALVVEAALRDFQASAMAGVPDVGPEAPAVTSRVPGPYEPTVLSEHRRVMMERQRRLNKSRGL